MENLNSLVRALCGRSTEEAWFEFKHENYSPQTIGEDISALSNGAALEEQPNAYFIWGVDNVTHNILGTEHDLRTLKKGNEELENWLRGLLSKNADFEYDRVVIDGKSVGVLRISKAMGQPVKFQKTAYVRIGSYTKKLSEYPAVESRLWKRLHNEDYETQISLRDLSGTQAVQKLEYGLYFDLLNVTLPSNEEGILYYLAEDHIIEKQVSGLYTITNLGAILLAKNIREFPAVSRKALRIIQYEGTNRLNMLREETIQKGYAAGFEEAIRYVSALLPSREVITGAVRKTELSFAPLALREAIANALIHQDLSITGVGPMIELFSNRIEITNPGQMLVNIMRVVDNPPRSRNEMLSSLMRRMGLCEEAGTGWDKIVISTESMQLPAPKIDLYEENTKVTLYSEMKYSSLNVAERLWACYLHACILFVNGEQLTNSSLRARFNVADTNSGSISRLIKDAVKEGLIKPMEETSSRRYVKYIPFWA